MRSGPCFSPSAAACGWLATLLSITVTKVPFLAGISPSIIIAARAGLWWACRDTGGQMLVRARTNPRPYRRGKPNTGARHRVMLVTIATAQYQPSGTGAADRPCWRGPGGALFHLDTRHGSDGRRTPVPKQSSLDGPARSRGRPNWGRGLRRRHGLPFMQTSAVAGSFPYDQEKPDNVSRDFAGVGAGSRAGRADRIIWPSLQSAQHRNLRRLAGAQDSLTRGRRHDDRVAVLASRNDGL